MAVTIKEVKTKKELRAFIHLPAKLHKEHQTWIPPVYMDDRAYFNPAKNESFKFCDTTLLLAYREDQVVGRIMGIIHKSYNRQHNEQTARFNYFESINDKEIFDALILSVENWARAKGMTELVGPFGFSDKDPEGFMIEGYQHMAIIVTNQNYPFMVDRIVAAGYEKKVDCIDYMLPIAERVPELYTRIYERISKKREYKLIEFKNRKQIKPYIRPVFNLMNEAYKDIYGFVPMTEKEMDEFAKRYLPILNPDFIKVVEKNNEVISFIIAIPNFSEGLQKSKGYILPFGIFHIFRSMRKTKKLDLMLGAIRSDHRGTGLDVIMGYNLINSARKYGMDKIECHLVLETNAKMRAEMERMGAENHKRFRIFRKTL